MIPIESKNEFIQYINQNTHIIMHIQCELEYINRPDGGLSVALPGQILQSFGLEA
jgi:hypothetical protein